MAAPKRADKGRLNPKITMSYGPIVKKIKPLDIKPRGALFRTGKHSHWRDTSYPPPVRSCVPHKKRTGNEPIHPLAIHCD